MKTKYLLSVGGLGNQLFICNFAHSLLECGVQRVEVLTGWHLKNERKSGLELIQKNCQHPIKLSRSYCKYFVARSLVFLQSRWLSKQLPTFLPIYIESLDESSRPITRNLIFAGYFQKTRYFPIANTFIDEVKQTCDQVLLSEVNLDALPKNFQGIHIRRGDYLAHSETFGLLSNEYFRSKIDDATSLVIASDDANLEYWSYLPKMHAPATFLTQTDPWQTLAILSTAERLVISNSSFSYWAALVVSSRGGSAVIPTPWFKKHPQYTPELGFADLETAQSTWSD